MSEYEGHLKYGDLRIFSLHEGEYSMWFIMFLIIMSELPDKFKCICFCVCCLIQGYSNTLDYYRHQRIDNIIEMSTQVHNEILTKLTKGSNDVYEKSNEEASR